MKNTAAMLAAATAMLLGAPALAQETSPPPAREEATPDVATAHVIVLHGTNDGKGIDPSIGKLPQLKQPPFSSYDSYKLLGKKHLGLKEGETASTDLPKGKLTLQLLAASAKKQLFKLQARVEKPGGKTLVQSTIKAKAGRYFFLAGQKYKKGILVLGIRVAGK